MPLTRRLTPELMDDPAIAATSHLHALAGLARLNRLSRSARTLFTGVRRVAGTRTDPRILDVATGSGDLLIGLASIAQRHGLSPVLSACDISDRALERARHDANNAGVEARFFVHDAIHGGPLPEADIVTCSLFLHHLTRDDAIALIKNMARNARLGIVVNDLRRTRAGVALAALASRLFTRSPVVHTDAVLSARAAWTIDETRELFESAGLRNATITPRWPSRFLATWTRDDA